MFFAVFQPTRYGYYSVELEVGLYVPLCNTKINIGDISRSETTIKEMIKISVAYSFYSGKAFTMNQKLLVKNDGIINSMPKKNSGFTYRKISKNYGDFKIKKKRKMSIVELFPSTDPLKSYQRKSTNSSEVIFFSTMMADIILN